MIRLAADEDFNNDIVRALRRAQTMEFTKAESSASTSYPCYELGLSPDQNHLFFACSNGTTPTQPGQRADFDPTDLGGAHRASIR